ncbi:MAG: hypothetical protein KFB97_13200 [Cyanobium sp. M30B3]|nr:MAG: hypothetical protein KFB97_13200 [Cyanobium sp. M30B3]
MAQPLIPQRPDHAQAHALRIELSQLRATTPSAGRQLNVAALIRDDRDGR